MRCRQWMIVAVAVLLLVGTTTTVVAQGSGNDGSRSNPFERTDENRIDAPTLPDPVAPWVPTVLRDEVQLVGFSPMPVPADRGILNMTLACQRGFVGSRICTAEEVRRTVEVPVLHNASRFGSAWISSEGLSDDMLVGQSDCVGWTSNSSQDRGMAMAIGPEHACYGGFMQAKCSEEMLVACCAVPSEVWQPRRER